MSEEDKQLFNKMIYCSLIDGEQAIKFKRKYEDLQQKVEQLEKELQITANKCKQLENIKTEDIEYVDFNKLLDILNKGYYKNEIKGEKHD